MRKSVVTTVVTAMFVLYSFYQRTIGMPASADAGSVPNVTSPISNSSQGPSVSSAPAPDPFSSQDSSQSNPTQAQAGNSAASASQATQTPTQQSGSQYRNGTYTGSTADAFYGSMQVQATIANGKLTNVQFIQWPNDRFRSVRINQQALPELVQEAIQAQSANVDAISGATDSSGAFVTSLQSALSQAKD